MTAALEEALRLQLEAAEAALRDVREVVDFAFMEYPPSAENTKAISQTEAQLETLRETLEIARRLSRLVPRAPRERLREVFGEPDACGARVGEALRAAVPPQPPPKSGWAIVCGGCDYADRQELYRVLDRCRIAHGFSNIMVTTAPGAADLAVAWAIERGLGCAIRPADKYGGAYALRSQAMLSHKPDLVVTFPGGPGTAHMVTEAHRAGVLVVHSSEVV